MSFRCFCVVLSVTLCGGHPVVGDEIPEKPFPTGMVDYVLDPRGIVELESTIRKSSFSLEILHGHNVDVGIRSEQGKRITFRRNQIKKLLAAIRDKSLLVVSVEISIPMSEKDAIELAQSFLSSGWKRVLVVGYQNSGIRVHSDCFADVSKPSKKGPGTNKEKE